MHEFTCFFIYKYLVWLTENKHERPIVWLHTKLNTFPKEKDVLYVLPKSQKYILLFLMFGTT